MDEAGIRQIEAVIKREKVPDVDKALRNLGVSGMTMIEAVGRGRDKLIVTSYVKGKWTFTTDFIHHAVINIVVDAKEVDKVIRAIVKAASTKHIGDGKIFVFPVERVIDISTGETDDHGLAPMQTASASSKKT
jgi:nitrogen regulatory protein PII